MMAQAMRSVCLRPIASYRAYDKTNDDEDRAVLKDLTGNGHDIQLHNFAFSEGSGYGKYANDFSRFSAHPGNVGKVLYTKNKIEVIDGLSNSFLTFSYSTVMQLNEMKVEIKGYKTDIYYRYANEDGNMKTIVIKNNGIYELPKSFIYKDSTFDVGFHVEYDSSIDYTGLTIEQIPDYQGALVSDGVDDYGLCENFPDLPIDKGFTVCAMRKWINQSPNINAVFLSTRTRDNNGVVWGPFTIEKISVSGGVPLNYGIIPYGGTSRNYYNLPINNKPFVYCTSSKYNDILLVKGDKDIQYNILNLFCGDRGGTEHSSVALYALEIYDRDLTDEEIAKVKARMIAEYEEKTGNKYEEETV